MNRLQEENEELRDILRQLLACFENLHSEPVLEVLVDGDVHLAQPTDDLADLLQTIMDILET
jgi:hypothetical protein